MTKEELKLYNRDFGLRVKARRRELNLKAERVAELAGITPQFLSEVERGKKSTRAPYVAALADALSTTSDSLLYAGGRGARGLDSRDRAEELADLILSYPPAQREMAAEMLLAALKMVAAGVPN